MCDACTALAIRTAILLGGPRFSLTNEKAAQAEIADHLTECGIAFTREHRLDDKNIIDFLIGGHIGVEVKLRYPRLQIRRQLARYAAFDAIHVLILASNTALALPASINGKALINVSLGKAWL